MATELISMTIQGVSPLLMHAFPMVPIESLEKKSPNEQAEFAAYRDPEGILYIPGIALQRAIVNGAAYSKGKGRASLQKVVAACLQISPERLSLGRKDYTVDARPIVVPATRGRVMRYRPRLDKWEVTCEIEFDPNLITATQVRRVIDDTGSRVGLLDFRPEKKGPFGRFIVSMWKNSR